jgi:hypothetical protein
MKGKTDAIKSWCLFGLVMLLFLSLIWIGLITTIPNSFVCKITSVFLVGWGIFVVGLTIIPAIIVGVFP